MFQNKLNYRIINLAALMLLLYIGITNISLWWQVFSKITSVLAPFIIGFAFAYAFTPLVHLLEKQNISHKTASIIIMLSIIVLVFGLLAMLLPTLYEQLALFLNMVLEVIENLRDKIPLNIGSFEIKITDYLKDILKEISMITSQTTIEVVSKSINFISKFIVGFVGFIYFLVDMDKFRDGLKNLLMSINVKLYKYVKCMDEEITNYLKGLELFMLIQFFEYSFIFLIIGHPNWLILGLLACITTVIPYFGGLITNIIAILMASVVSTPLLIATIIICLIFPQLDGYLISPKVYGKTNDVNPLITIMAVSVGGTLLGISGIIIALPCYLLIRTTCKFFLNDLKKGMNIVKEKM